MKKNSETKKPLLLSRETLRMLDSQKLVKIAGGEEVGTPTVTTDSRGILQCCSCA